MSNLDEIKRLLILSSDGGNYEEAIRAEFLRLGYDRVGDSHNLCWKPKANCFMKTAAKSGDMKALHKEIEMANR